MTWKELNNYQVAWRQNQKYGVVKVFHKDGSNPIQIEPLTFEDYTSMVDMLRNEKPVYYDSNQKALSTIKEEVGEEET